MRKIIHVIHKNSQEQNLKAKYKTYEPSIKLMSQVQNLWAKYKTYEPTAKLMSQLQTSIFGTKFQDLLNICRTKY